MYHVFVRNWYKLDKYGRLEPAPRARKYTLARVATYSEARAICEEYNSTHNPGRLSRKAEFMQE